MKPTLFALVFSLAAACTAQPDESRSASATTPDAATDGIDLTQVPTQDEADAAATNEINTANADAEFEKLKAEIGGK